MGVPWLGWSCGTCAWCLSDRENLCDRARYTGYQIDGGYAELTVADARYCFPIDPSYTDAEAAPLPLTDSAEVLAQACVEACRG